MIRQRRDADTETSIKDDPHKRPSILASAVPCRAISLAGLACANNSRGKRNTFNARLRQLQIGIDTPDVLVRSLRLPGVVTPHISRVH
jgi:hypothetical protein